MHYQQIDDLEKTMSLTWEYRELDSCFAAEGLAYCEHPTVPALQRLNIYVPSAFLDSNGSLRPGATVTTASGAVYTAASVPVVFYNDIGGYAECAPAGLTERNRRFLENGYVLVSVGARGRQTRDGEGEACGKAPSALVDLKAAVRWLRAHAAELPAGNVDRIISVGTSAGGAMSSLLGVTGNAVEYLPMLEEIGAVMDERDDIFAAQCYCPIVDLEHADMAYEWMFGAKTIYTFGPRCAPEVLDVFSRGLSQELSSRYPAYINGLALGVELGKDGRSGSYYTELMGYVAQSLEIFLDKHAQTNEERSALIRELDPDHSFIEVDENGRAAIVDLDAYVLNYIGRMKGCPAFDSMDGKSPENQEFGEPGSRDADQMDRRHFSSMTAQAIAGVEASVCQTACAASKDYESDLASLDERMVELINPMTFACRKIESTVAPHVRIRLGSRDADHSFSASFNLYRALRQRGIDVDYGLVWGRGHCDADRPGEFGAWVDSICR